MLLKVKWRNPSTWKSIQDQINSALLLALQTCTIQGLVPSHLQLVLLQLCLLLLLPQPQGQLAEGEAVIVQRRPHARHRRRSNLATKGQQLQSGKSELKLDASSFPLSVCPGVVNVLVTTPLWVVNTRLKLQGSKFRSADIQPTNYAGIFGITPIILLDWSQFHFIVFVVAEQFAAIFFSFQMRFSRLFAMRAWALCGTAPSRPSCWCWTLPSSSWFMKDWRGSWRKAFPGRWVRGEIKWGLGILEYVKTKKDEEETSVQRVIIQQPW